MFFSGSTYHLGNFDECMDIGKNLDDYATTKTKSFGSQYCLSKIKIVIPEEPELKNSLSSIWQKFTKLEQRYDEKIDELYWGVCVPDSCTNVDIENVITNVFTDTFAKINFGIEARIEERACYKDDSTDVITSYQIAYL